MVLREVWMKHDIHQPLQPARSSGLNLRHASHRPGIEAAVSYDAKAAGPFGDEQGAVGKERNRPRLFEMVRYQLDT